MCNGWDSESYQLATLVRRYLLFLGAKDMGNYWHYKDPTPPTAEQVQRVHNRGVCALPQKPTTPVKGHAVTTPLGAPRISAYRSFFFFLFRAIDHLFPGLPDSETGILIRGFLAEKGSCTCAQLVAALHPYWHKLRTPSGMYTHAKWPPVTSVRRWLQLIATLDGTTGRWSLGDRAPPSKAAVDALKVAVLQRNRSEEVASGSEDGEDSEEEEKEKEGDEDDNDVAGRNGEQSNPEGKEKNDDEDDNDNDDEEEEEEDDNEDDDNDVEDKEETGDNGAGSQLAAPPSVAPPKRSGVELHSTDDSAAKRVKATPPSMPPPAPPLGTVSFFNETMAFHLH